MSLSQLVSVCCVRGVVHGRFVTITPAYALKDVADFGRQAMVCNYTGVFDILSTISEFNVSFVKEDDRYGDVTIYSQYKNAIDDDKSSYHKDQGPFSTTFQPGSHMGPDSFKAMVALIIYTHLYSSGSYHCNISMKYKSGEVIKEESNKLNLELTGEYTIQLEKNVAPYDTL